VQSAAASWRPVQRPPLVEPMAKSVKGLGKSGPPVSCFIDPCMVNCQEIGTLNESSENEPGIAGLGGAYRQGSDGDGAISKGR